MSGVVKHRVVQIIPGGSELGLAKTQGTRIILEDGSELNGAYSVKLSCAPNDLWHAEISLYAPIGAHAGMKAVIDQRKASWWRTLLCKLAGVQLEVTTLESTEMEFRLP